jgi:hypothetical protein
MSHLIPEQRTNKNGVTSTKWVRPEGKKKKASRIPAPTTPVSKKRLEDAALIQSAVAQRQIYMGPIARTLELAKDEELSILAEAFANNDEAFANVASKTVALSGMVNAVAIAVVYDPELPRQHMVPKIHEALREANMYLLDIADDDLTVADYIDLATCDDSTRTQVKRFVAAFCAMKFDREHFVDWDIMEQVMDASRDDNDRAIEIIREEPSLSLSELNFRLEGGHTAISRGAL